MSDPASRRERFYLAVGFLTRIPVPAIQEFTQTKLDDASRDFVLVGVIIGLINALVVVLAMLIWGSQPLAVVLMLAGSIALTGAFHEDGFADFCDGFGGQHSAERTQAIMKDSRLGTFGVSGLLAILSLKTLGLITIESLPAMLAVLVWVHGASRATVTRCLVDEPAAAGQGKAKPLAQTLSHEHWLIGLWPLLPFLFILNWAYLLLSVALLWGIKWSMMRWIRYRLGGYTGDCLGAIQQLAELGVILLAAAVLL